MRQELTTPLNLKSIAQLKIRWKVSMQAIIRRARDLEIISDRAYRYLFEQMAWRGWRVKEPASVAVPIERPRGLREMAELIYGKPINLERLSSATLVGTNRLKQIMDAHAGYTEHIEGARQKPEVVMMTARRGERTG
jgi:Zn-dependent peptidase ImmA (M78 family)